MEGKTLVDKCPQATEVNLKEFGVIYKARTAAGVGKNAGAYLAWNILVFIIMAASRSLCLFEASYVHCSLKLTCPLTAIC